MAERKATAFFYLEEGETDLLLYSQELDRCEVERERMDYEEYVEERNRHEALHEAEPMDIYSLAELYLEEHPVGALKSDLLDGEVSRDVADELRRKRREGEEVDRETLVSLLDEEKLTELVDMQELRDRVAVELGNVSA